MRLIQRVFDPDVQCPAAKPIGEGDRRWERLAIKARKPQAKLEAKIPPSSGAHCVVEDSDVLAADQAGSLVSFCLSADGYRTCPTWQAEKERIEAQRRQPLNDTAGSVTPGQVKVAGA